MKHKVMALSAVVALAVSARAASAEDFTFSLNGMFYLGGSPAGYYTYDGSISGLSQGAGQTPTDLKLDYSSGTADFGPEGSFDVQDGQITKASFSGSSGGDSLTLYGANGGGASEYNGEVAIPDGRVSYTPVAGSSTPPSSGGGGGPEPSTWALMMVGVFGAGATLRRRQGRGQSLRAA